MLQNLKFKKAEPTDLQIEIARLLEIMKNLPPAGEDYAKVSEQYAKLTKLSEEIISKKRVSPDALTGAATSLTSILLILHYEHAHVMTSKAIGFVMKNIR